MAKWDASTSLRKRSRTRYISSHDGRHSVCRWLTICFQDINNLDELGPNYVIGREQKFDEEKYVSLAVGKTMRWCLSSACLSCRGLNKAKLLFGFQPKATREDTCVDIAAALTPSAALWRGGIAAATSTSVPKGYLVLVGEGASGGSSSLVPFYSYHATLLPGSTRYLTMHAIDAIHCSGGLVPSCPPSRLTLHS